jgi:hypothetical protein
MGHIALSSELGEEEKEEARKGFDLVKLEAALSKMVNIQQMSMQLTKGQAQEKAINQKMSMPGNAGALDQEVPEQQVSPGQNKMEDMFAGTEQEKQLFNT